MARKSVQQREALRRAGDRRRAEDAAEHPIDPDAARQSLMRDRHTTDETRRRFAAMKCGWCEGPLEVKARGRLPKWCSATCRQRAWEQSRAHASGRGAVELVERRIEVPVPELPRQAQWVTTLTQLAAELNHGGLYDKHLDAIAPAVADVVTALNRRQETRVRH